MHVMAMIAGIDAKKQTAQDAPGTIFSRGSLPRYPPFRPTRNLEDGFRASTVFETFGRWKTVWTLPSLWTHRTRPQVTWKTAKSAVFHSVHTDHSFLEEEKRNEEELHVCQSDCLNRGVHPTELCPFLCPPRLEFDVFWYERLIGKKRELMAGFIGPSASVRLRLKSSRRNC